MKPPRKAPEPPKPPPVPQGMTLVPRVEICTVHNVVKYELFKSVLCELALVEESYEECVNRALSLAEEGHRALVEAGVVSVREELNI